jgi:hypothetical protein
LIFLIASRDIVAFIARSYTWLPPAASTVAQKLETTLAGVPEGLRRNDPLREAIITYTHLAGTESGYAFFAPNVPNNYKLVFELHYPDGRIEYDLPHTSSASAGYRVATLVDNIGETDSDDLREVMVKMLAYSVWQRHSEATMIRAVIGFANLPTAAEFRHGVRESNEFLYAYDFSFPAPGDGKAP